MSSKSKIAPRPLEPERRAIVVGASSGIGAALVAELAAHGYLVAAVARREAMLKGVCDAVNARMNGTVVAMPYTHNVTDFDEISGLFQTISRDLGGLDLIVYVAAIQPAITVDEYDTVKDLATVKTNLMGAIGWLNQAAVRFRKAGTGHIAALGSIAGDRGRVGSPAYGSTKAALETYMEALRNRLSRHGVTVTTIKPGFVDTVLLENAARTFWVISPAEAASQIVRSIKKKRQTVYVPGRWRLVGIAIRHVPSFIFRRLSF